MQIFELADGGPTPRIVEAPALSVPLSRLPVRYYRHGWQSWSLTAWTDVDSRLPVQKPHILHPMQHDPLYAFQTHPHGSWVGAVELEGGETVLLGSLGFDAHVELREGRLEGRYEAGSGRWLICRGDEITVFSQYAAELGKTVGYRTRGAPPRVWCSWYGLYGTIDERILGRVFEGLEDLPFDVLQVDDGWQKSIGDWEANGKFPAGMQTLAQEIKSTGRRAGLWLAPLIAVKSSKLFREHKDWFLRDERGRLMSAGFNWGEQVYALDTSQPRVLDWLALLMQRVRAWGYDYLKLDFLYGGGLPGKRAQTRQQTISEDASQPGEMTREAAYRLGLDALRRGMGDDAYFLACGAPIIPSLGICDGIRIGPDAATEWESERDAILLHNPTIPGARNAIRTALHRLWLKPLVHIDPDVVYFRSVECNLTPEQKLLLQSLALICGFKTTSDLPQWLGETESEELRQFLEAEPAIERLDARVFRVDGQEVEFSSMFGLAEAPTGWMAMRSGVFGWLANHGWALRYNHWTRERALRRLRRNLRE